MRVLLVHNFYQIPGGEDSVVREELAMLQSRGIDTELYSVSNDEITGTRRRMEAALGLLYNLRARSALAQKLAERRPDVVHIHNFFPLLSPSVLDACRAAGVPVVMTLHNFRILCPSALLHSDPALRERSLTHACWWTVPRKVYRNSLAGTLALATMVELHKRIGTWRRKVDRFIALTDWAKAKFIEGGLPAERIAVKPSGVSRPAIFGGSSRSGALFVGRLDEQKGIEVLLRAWASLEYPLTIIGDGPLAGLVHNAGDRIRWLGRQPREIVQKEMQTARMLVLPSLGHEMFPMTVVEAFSNGLPVVCSALPSLGALIAPGVTGATFSPGDATALAVEVRRLLDNPAWLDGLGAHARATYEACYTPEINCDRLVGIYRSLCPRRTPRGSCEPTD